MPMIGRYSGRGVTKSVVNRQAAGGASGGIAQIDASATIAASGSMTAATLKTALSISGVPGKCDLLAVASVDATSRTHRVKITIDGVVVFDATSTAFANAGQVFCPVGNIEGTAKVSPATAGNELVWGYQFLVEIASSLTETNMTNFYCRYKTEG